MQSERKDDKKIYSTKKLLSLSDEFDSYDIVDHLNESEPVEFDVELTRRHFNLEKSLAEKISKLSYKRGISPETYINLVLQEKVLEEAE